MQQLHNPYVLKILAQTTYGEQVYGSEAVTYSGTECIGSTCVTSPLANTGFTVWFAVTLSSVLIFSALLVRFWRKPDIKKK